MRRWSAMLRPAFVVVLIAACLVIPRASRAQGPAAAFIEQRITQAGQVPRLPQGQSDLPGRKAAALGSQRWKIETVDTGLGLYDGRVCLRLDAEGRPHIVYGQGYTGLRYARWDGYAWQTETLVAGQDVAQSTSLALDSLGSPHIVYGARQGLFYLRRSGGAWVSECIDPHAVNTMTFLASLALDRSGRPHVAYADQSRACVYYATASGGAWSIATVACGLGEWSGCPSLALDSRDRPAIGYSNGPHVFLARPSGAAWQSELVASYAMPVLSATSASGPSWPLPRPAALAGTCTPRRAMAPSAGSARRTRPPTPLPPGTAARRG